MSVKYKNGERWNYNDSVSYNVIVDLIDGWSYIAENKTPNMSYARGNSFGTMPKESWKGNNSWYNWKKLYGQEKE